MKALALAVLAFACASPPKYTGARATIADSAVVVLAQLGGEWTAICSGVMVGPNEILTSLDCAVNTADPGAELAVMDAWRWNNTVTGKVRAKLGRADYDRRLAVLVTEDELSGHVARLAAGSPSDGDFAIVGRSPEMVAKTTITKPVNGRGLVALGKHMDCHELMTGAGIYDATGALYAIITTGGIEASEYTEIGR